MDDIRIEDIFLFLIVMCGVAVIACIFAAVAKKDHEDTNATYPVQKGHAKLVDKPQTAANGIVVYSRIWVLFDLDDGTRVRLLVSGTQFPYVVGDSGELTWQGDSLLGFHRDGETRSTSSSETTAPPITGFDQNKIPTWKLIEMEQEKSDR